MTRLLQQQGFNLLEILLVLVIAAILLGVVYPSGQFLIESNRQATEVNQLLATLERARQQSLNAQRTVIFGQGEGCQSLQAASATADWSLCYWERSADTLGEQIYWRNDSSSYAIEASQVEIRFRPPPLTLAEPVYLLVDTGFNRVQPRVVRVAETGRAKVVGCAEAAAICN